MIFGMHYLLKCIENLKLFQINSVAKAVEGYLNIRYHETYD